MKTLKTLKITSIIQAIYCIYCLVSTFLLANGSKVIVFLFYSLTFKSISIVPICFIINLLYFWEERKYPEQKKLIGRKWIWMFVCAITATICYIIACLPFIRIPLF